jgi:Immunity protein 27
LLCRLGFSGIVATRSNNEDCTVAMNKLRPDERRLVGGLIFENGQVRGDAVSERIDWLLSHHLEMIADSPESGAWETLYKDPNDGRCWERTYPNSGMHGGGPMS